MLIITKVDRQSLYNKNFSNKSYIIKSTENFSNDLIDYLSKIVAIMIKEKENKKYEN